MKQGLFFTFEGIDGCGKTTQLKRAQDYLERKGLRCIVTREPGGTPIGEKIREILLSRDHGEMCDPTELLLYLAARAQHVAEKIRPAIQAGQIVLCDRFQEATFAYQGFGRGYDIEMLLAFNDFATSKLGPNHTFIFDIPVERALERLKKMGKEADRLEQNPVEFYEKTREGYRTLAQRYTGRMTLLDGCRSIDDLSADVRQCIDRLLAGTGCAAPAPDTA